MHFLESRGAVMCPWLGKHVEGLGRGTGDTSISVEGAACRNHHKVILAYLPREKCD